MNNYSRFSEIELYCFDSVWFRIQMYSKFTQINDSKQIVFVDAKMMSVITWALISSFTFPQLRWWAATNTMLIYSNLGGGFFSRHAYATQIRQVALCFSSRTTKTLNCIDEIPWQFSGMSQKAKIPLHLTKFPDFEKIGFSLTRCNPKLLILADSYVIPVAILFWIKTEMVQLMETLLQQQWSVQQFAKM